MTERFCIAEYCAADFYMGWWLYERDTNDGRRNADSDWGWMQDTSEWSPQQRLHELCRRMGHEPPPVARYSQTFAEWFAEAFPGGLHVARRSTHGDVKYTLLKIVQSRPRQRRGVIRTIRGAASAVRARKEAT